MAHNKSYICVIPHLKDFLDDLEPRESPLVPGLVKGESGEIVGFMPKISFVPAGSFVLAEKLYENYEQLINGLKFKRSGPSREIYFDPPRTKAAIVTCGGLCPGLNVVIRELVMCMWFNYGVRQIYGVKWGYRGFYENFPEHWIELKPSVVSHIHDAGGTILGSSRGGFDGEKIIKALLDQGVEMLFCIGGDGTHRGVNALAEIINARKLKIALVGVPKTIDNDIPILDKSFGFDTATEISEKMVEAATNEAIAAQNGIGLVKVMGRHAGFIAQNAALASREVNFCLVPEIPFELFGENGLYECVLRHLAKHNHAVIVVAEGADTAVLDHPEKKEEVKKDASGNVQHSDIGVFLKKGIVDYGKSKGIEITLKYIDPTYAIRSVQANSGDTILCTRLAHAAVHSAMAGHTMFSVG